MKNQQKFKFKHTKVTEVEWKIIQFSDIALLDSNIQTYLLLYKKRKKILVKACFFCNLTITPISYIFSQESNYNVALIFSCLVGNHHFR